MSVWTMWLSSCFGYPCPIISIAVTVVSLFGRFSWLILACIAASLASVANVKRWGRIMPATVRVLTEFFAELGVVFCEFVNPLSFLKYQNHLRPQLRQIRETSSSYHHIYFCCDCFKPEEISGNLQILRLSRWLWTSHEGPVESNQVVLFHRGWCDLSVQEHGRHRNFCPRFRGVWDCLGSIRRYWKCGQHSMQTVRTLQTDSSYAGDDTKVFLPLFVVLTLFLANWVLIKPSPPAAPWGKCKVCGVTGAYEEIAMPSPFHKRFCISMHFDTSFCLVVSMMHLCYALHFSVERWAILREAGPTLPICNRLNLPLAPVKVGRCHFCGVADGAVPGGHHQVGAQNKFEQWKKSRLVV